MDFHPSLLFAIIVAHPLLSATLFFIFYLTIAIFIRSRRTSYPQPFPPGPSPIPFLGNLHQLPLQKPFLTFTQWSKTYNSPIIGLHLGGQPAVVLNTWRSVRDLFDNRGAIYSSRPNIPLLEYVLPGPYHVAFMPHSKAWRRGRAALVNFLREEELAKVLPIQQAESTQMVYEIARGSRSYEKHVLRAFCAVILESVYGVRGTRALTDRFFEIQDEWAGMLDMGAMPPLDVFPWLKHVPSVMTPWPRWKERSAELGRAQSGFYKGLFERGKEMVMKGGMGDTFLATLLERQEKEGFTDIEVVYLGGFLLEAGADTTAVALIVFILSMAAHPDAQRRAQDEIDRVFGDELPQDVDGSQLPFLEAVFWETLRWRPSFPTSLPHATTKDDVYDGYFIPAGTTALMNTWAIQHNEEDYPNADQFDPTRFLENDFGIAKSGPPSTDDTTRRRTYAFGAGRRVCAGQDMAEKSLLLSMAKLLWAFDMRPKEGGVLDTNVVTGFKDAILTGPKKVDVNFTVRSEAKAGIISSEWEKADAVLRKFE